MARRTVIPFAPAQTRRGRTKRKAPRVAPAAVRVPDPLHSQLELTFPSGLPQLFVHEGARQSVERRLAQAALQPVVLSVTDNRRAMISFAEKDGVLRARLHHMFLDAPSHVVDALVDFVVHRDRDASTVVGRYIEENSHRIRAHRPVLTPLNTQGQHHDLLKLFRRINDSYFDGSVDALVTWGRRQPKRSRREPRRMIKLGSYSPSERLIRIHPVLDKAWVPRYFISFIIYHEMLHHVIPASQGGGGRPLHPPVFRARERVFREFERAHAWERAHIHRLLRA